jgi:hypothetical protein
MIAGAAGSRTRGWLWAGLALAALVLGVQPARAQPGRRPPPAEIVNIDMGWTRDELVQGRWQPAVVWITSSEKAFSGVLTVSFPQDATQDAEVVVGPVATTPGMVTPVEIAISPVANAREVVFTLQNGGFRTQRRFTPEGRGGTDDLPRIGAGSSGVLLFVGQTSAVKALNTSSILSRSPPSGEAATFNEPLVWAEMLPAAIAPNMLPMSWGVYESLDMVVCNAADLARSSARARAALATWVRSGGRLVVRVDVVGPVWPAFLPTDGPQPPVTGSLQQLFEPGDDLRRALGEWGGAPFQARALTLSDAGRVRGWVTRFPAAAKEGNEAGALVAHGPLGLGMVTLVGFDPQHTAQLIPDEAVKDVWRAVIRPSLPPHALMAGWTRQYYGGANVDWETAGSINAALDELTSVPPIGTSVFWAIILCMFGLTIMVGPFDAFVLRRRKLSQHSWLTSLLWIGLASVAAALAPRVMRSGETVMGRVVVADRLCDDAGVPTHSAHLGLTGVFAGRSLRVAFANPAPGAWVRGVSATEIYWNTHSPVSILPDLPLALAADAAQDDLRSMAAGPISVPQWSYRALADAAPLATARGTEIGAAVIREKDAWRVTLTNVPAGATVEELLLRTGDAWHVLNAGAGAPSANGRDRIYVTSGEAFLAGQHDDTRTPAPVRRWLRRDPRQNEVYYGPPSATTAALPGVREREQAVETLVSSGGYACVYAKLRAVPLDLETIGVADHRLQKTDYLRLLTPLKEEP